jgi:DNA-binding CsgD family transcriptional regulator
MRRGALEAVPVVDRFPLVQHLRPALAAFLLDRRPALQAAAVCTAMARTPPPGPVPVTPLDRGQRRSSEPARQHAARSPRHARWVAIYEARRTLRAQGMPLATIARQLGLSRPTVDADRRRDTPPAPRSPQRSRPVLRPDMPDLIRRGREGISDSRPRWREIRAQGDAHSARTVGRFITRRRRATEAGQAPEVHMSPDTRLQGPSARAVSFASVCPAAKRSLAAHTSVDQRCQVDRGLARAKTLLQVFRTMVRERRGADLEAWRAEAMHRGIEALARFARGLQDDLTAVTAGRTVAWSNGATAGQMHRLTLVKRPGDGRAGCALLRQRPLLAA